MRITSGYERKETGYSVVSFDRFHGILAGISDIRHATVLVDTNRGKDDRFEILEVGEESPEFDRGP
jgi:hypothetical protein